MRLQGRSQCSFEDCHELSRPAPLSAVPASFFSERVMPIICLRLHSLLTLASLGLFLVSDLALADGHQVSTSELRRCRALLDDSQRLSCFDRAVPPAKSVLAPGTAESMPAEAPSTTTSGTIAAANPSLLSKPPARSAPPDTTAQFGLARLPTNELQAITSEVQGLFEGWSRGSRLQLVNGQVWEVTDNSVATYRLQAPKATVRRGLLGSYFLEVDGIAQTPRVRRIK